MKVALRTWIAALILVLVGLTGGAIAALTYSPRWQSDAIVFVAPVSTSSSSLSSRASGFTAANYLTARALNYQALAASASFRQVVLRKLGISTISPDPAFNVSVLNLSTSLTISSTARSRSVAVDSTAAVIGELQGVSSRLEGTAADTPRIDLQVAAPPSAPRAVATAGPTSLLLFGGGVGIALALVYVAVTRRRTSRIHLSTTDTVGS